MDTLSGCSRPPMHHWCIDILLSLFFFSLFFSLSLSHVCVCVCVLNDDDDFVVVVFFFLLFFPSFQRSLFLSLSLNNDERGFFFA